MMSQLLKTLKHYNAAVNKDDECAVCLESYTVTEASILPCKHSFCAKCIKKWQDKGTCPWCRFDKNPQMQFFTTLYRPIFISIRFSSTFFGHRKAFQPRDLVGNDNDFFKNAIQKQGNGNIESVVIDGSKEFLPISDDIDWTKVIKIKTASWKSYNLITINLNNKTFN